MWEVDFAACEVFLFLDMHGNALHTMVCSALHLYFSLLVGARLGGETSLPFHFVQ